MAFWTQAHEREYIYTIKKSDLSIVKKKSNFLNCLNNFLFNGRSNQPNTVTFQWQKTNFLISTAADAHKIVGT